MLRATQPATFQGKVHLFNLRINGLDGFTRSPAQSILPNTTAPKGCVTVKKAIYIVLLTGMLSMSFAGAKPIDATLDYAVAVAGDHVQLTLDSEKATATLTSITLLLPDSTSEKVARKQVPLAKPVPLSPKAVVDLGSVLAVSREIAPQRAVSENAITASEQPMGCGSCRSIPFAIEIHIDYADGMKKQILTDAYLRYSTP